MEANALGVADFPLRAGGTCSGGSIKVHAGGAPLATRTAVASPDQNGDAVVNATDNAILGVKLAGPYDPTADFNCSGALEAGDQAILTVHGGGGHGCSVVVPVWPGTWGRLKILYRE